MKENSLLENMLEYFSQKSDEEIINYMEEIHTAKIQLIKMYGDLSKDDVDRLYLGNKMLEAIIDLQSKYLVLGGALITKKDNDSGISIRESAEKYAKSLKSICE